MLTGFACNACSTILDCNPYGTLLDKKMFVVVYLESGEVYLWGSNPTKSPISVDYFMKPTLIEGMSKKVIKVACGESHFLALTEFGQVIRLSFLLNHLNCLILLIK